MCYWPARWLPTQHEEGVRQQILEGLIADKGADNQVSTATRIVAEVIPSDASWLMIFNGGMQWSEGTKCSRSHRSLKFRASGSHPFRLLRSVDLIYIGGSAACRGDRLRRRAVCYQRQQPPNIDR